MGCPATADRTARRSQIVQDRPLHRLQGSDQGLELSDPAEMPGFRTVRCHLDAPAGIVYQPFSEFRVLEGVVALLDRRRQPAVARLSAEHVLQCHAAVMSRIDPKLDRTDIEM